MKREKQRVENNFDLFNDPIRMYTRELKKFRNHKYSLFYRRRRRPSTLMFYMRCFAYHSFQLFFSYAFRSASVFLSR